MLHVFYGVALFKRLPQNGLLQSGALREGAGEVGLELVDLGLKDIEIRHNVPLIGERRNGDLI